MRKLRAIAQLSLVFFLWTGPISGQPFRSQASQVMPSHGRNLEWPVLKSYEGKYLDEVAMPLGGIGTGTVSLGGRGDLRDWELMNRGALDYLPAFKFVPPTI